jgi:hypothetical protein
MNRKIFLPLVFTALLFWAGSTAALADNYRGYGRSHYSHRVAPHFKHYGYGHDYRGHRYGGHGYHNGWKYHGKHDYYGPSFGHHYYPHRWHGGPFFGGTFFLPGWGVVFGHHGRW